MLGSATIIIIDGYYIGKPTWQMHTINFIAEKGLPVHVKERKMASPLQRGKKRAA